jgi:hypothetical protein
VDKLLWKDSSYSFVAIVPAGKGAQTPFAHPVALTPEQLNEALRQLQVSVDGGKPTRVFPPAAIDMLVEPLSRGLAEAGPEQELLIQTVSRDPALGLLFGPTVTNARVFAADGFLQFVFGEARGEFSNEFRATGVLRAFVKPDRNSGRETNWALVGDALALSNVSGDPAHAAVSPAAWSHVAVPEARSTTEPTPGPGLGAPVTAAAVAAPAASAMSSTPAAASVSSAPAATTPTPAAAPPLQTSERFAERLRTLERLHEEGLITDQEYATKRQDILNEI